VVASADPDGYTILLTPGGSLTTGPAVHKNLGYDPLKAFVPIGLVMETPQALSVHPDLPVKTMAELVAYAKANPGKISFGSQGFGVGPHLMLELFKLDTGIKMTHVPYRGTAPMLTALLTGEVQLVIDPTTTSLVHIQSGKIRPLAVASATRTPALPDVPTTVEAGYPKLVSAFWLGVVAPAGTPPAIVAKLNARSAKRSPRRNAGQAGELRRRGKIGTPEAFGKQIADELALWQRVVRDANLAME